ncbi:MAG: low molecular weight phosphotyrosine protein phosphatase, partial [Gemmatimonadetes bacterium]|nr:low molecular weight phosphotyrosine protein phosphatase [Gemmatimonadota bacterium]NIQ52780.1 low molecular weight phosphotyrosine protein phosphatase [Gemmatimonadota bacterium]NIU72910.1 low molecular weight phosphotyrosine protein phosphatase [Gammaproteobacteria bacterium]NIX43270.1 low molecular weight phosphotyrosine protein phosphatase [Gemmatimonadota bacterium]NIY07447.1 low molecular weight phosphotyrosine protein phosphatase [Gemmatimonadota bacterium]
PDPRTSEVAARRGVDVIGSSRRVTQDDVASFDYLVAMDEDNRQVVERMAAGAGGSPEVRLLREFDPD